MHHHFEFTNFKSQTHHISFSPHHHCFSFPLFVLFFFFISFLFFLFCNLLNYYMDNRFSIDIGVPKPDLGIDWWCWWVAVAGSSKQLATEEREDARSVFSLFELSLLCVLFFYWTQTLFLLVEWCVWDRCEREVKEQQATGIQIGTEKLPFFSAE